MEGLTVSKPVRVIVCDDDDERAAEWSERIEEAAGASVSVSHLTTDEFAAAAAALKERKAHAKQHGDIPTTSDPATPFDEADVVVLDSDLTPDAGSSQGTDPSPLVQQHLIGELGGEIAHLARCYSKAGALVVVNQKWKRRSFDLTLLTFASDVAEVYISETDLDNQQLWQAPVGDREAFRPWSWPVLVDLPVTLEELIKSVDLTDHVLPTLGLTDPAVLSAFTDRQLDALGIEAWEQMSFDDVATESSLGLRLKETVGDEQRLRIAVCAVRRWLDRLVVPSHNVLIDLPHLLQQRPWAVSDRDEIDDWNAAAGWFASYDDTSSAVDPAPEAYAAAASRWLGRHVWQAPLVARSPRTAEQRVLPTDPVFCEDISAFHDPNGCVDFVSDLEGPTGQRFVRSLTEVDYHPRRRLLT